MSVRLMSQAFHARLPSSQKLVLLVLCDYANDEGLSCHPSIAQVAKKASLSERQCKRVMKELIDGEWIAVIGNEFGGAPGSTRNYKINLKTLFRGDTHDTPEQSLTGDTHDTGDKLTRVTSATETGDKSCTRRVTNRAETGDTHDTQSTIEPSIEPPKNHQRDSAREAIAYLNERVGARYQNTKTNLGHVNARLSEGNSLDDVKAVIDFKAQEWGSDPKMRQYLRPETLFSQSKFPGYLTAARASPPQSRHTGFSEREYTEHTPDWAKEA